jgi:hypothetical protein
LQSNALPALSFPCRSSTRTRPPSACEHAARCKSRPSSWTCGRWTSPARSSVAHDRPPLPVAWTIEEANNACFVFKDANGFAVSYVYFEQETGRRAATNLMTKDEARRIAANIARLPELLGAEPKPGANALVQRR